MCQHHTTCRLDTEGHINQAAHAHNSTHHHSRNCIGRHTERHMNQAVVRAPNSTQQHERNNSTHKLHIGRHKRSRHLRAAQRAVEPSRFPAHICNVHKTSCILPFNHYDPPRSATQNTRSSPHAILVFHHHRNKPNLSYTYQVRCLDVLGRWLCRKSSGKCHKRKTN